MFSLKGKFALVTGATGGIGQAIAAGLLQQGATVILSGTKQEKLTALAAELGGKNLHTLAANLGDSASIAELIKQAEALAGGGLDILVCNAGVTKDNLAMRMSEQDWDEVLNLNLKAPFLLAKAAMRGMMKKKGGRIVNIGSIVGSSGNPGQANYVSSKAGLVGLGKSLAQELASRGITVNTVAPGFIRTPMTDALTPAQQEAMQAKIPLGFFGEPSDVAAAVAYLSSDEARYITGQTLHVNGGMYMI